MELFSHFIWSYKNTCFVDIRATNKICFDKEIKRVFSSHYSVYFNMIIITEHKGAERSFHLKRWITFRKLFKISTITLKMSVCTCRFPWKRLYNYCRNVTLLNKDSIIILRNWKFKSDFQNALLCHLITAYGLVLSNLILLQI